MGNTVISQMDRLINYLQENGDGVPFVITEHNHCSSQMILVSRARQVNSRLVDASVEFRNDCGGSRPIGLLIPEASVRQGHLRRDHMCNQ
jgi:hypothetical protein